MIVCPPIYAGQNKQRRKTDTLPSRRWSTPEDAHQELTREEGQAKVGMAEERMRANTMRAIQRSKYRMSKCAPYALHSFT
jgi:hypothetical protein